jgi:hypothetical protein
MRMKQLRILAVTALALAAPMAAEARQANLSIDLTGAWVGFPDDGTVSETLIGGAARWQIRPRLPRLSIGPEVVYLQGENHTHLVVTGNLVFDFMPDQAVQPFLVAGGGMFQTHEEFFDDAFTSREGAFTAGGGVRVRAGDRVSVGIDARVGWELHVRVGGVISVRLGR